MYRVIIVEDDPMVASINRQYVDRNPRFCTVGVFRNGQEGLKNTESLEKRPEVIMVTAVNAADTVRKLMGVGIS